MMSPQRHRHRRRHLARSATLLALLLALCCPPLATPAYAQIEEQGSEPAAELEAPGPIHDLGANVVDAFTGWNLALHLGGIAATAVMSPSGADYEIHRFFAEHPDLGAPTDLAVEAGDIMPFLVSGGLLGYGYLLDSPREVGAGWAALQATVLSFGYVTLLKALTGRPPPPEDDPTADARELSETWRFGFWRGGVFHGWPSGHTMVAMSLMSSVATYYADYWWVGALASSPRR